MCGRYTLKEVPEDLKRNYRLKNAGKIKPRYNIAPGQYVPVVMRDEEFPDPLLQMLKWGLIPPWEKKPDLAKSAINARAETIAEKPYFKGAVRHKRCLIPADGFYEWPKSKQDRDPFYFQMAGEAGFCFAGLWERCETDKGEIMDTCAIITTDANELVKPVHNRMPVILSQENYDFWLDTDVQSFSEIRHLLVPFAYGKMKTMKVSRKVNDAAYDAPDCVEPVKDSLELF